MLTYLAAVMLAAQPAEAQTPSTDQPPIILTIDGQPHELHDGVTTSITIDGQTYEVRVDLPTVARFTGQLITFDYPSNIASVLKEPRDSGTTVSRFTAKDATLIVLEFNQRLPFDPFFESIVSEFEGADVNLITGQAAFETNLATLDGRFMQVQIAGSYIRQEIYRVGTDKASTFLIFQDGRVDPAVPTPEYTRLTETFANSFNTR